MKNKNLIYIVIAAAGIFYYLKKKGIIKGIEQQAKRLTKKEAAKLNFKIDTRTMKDIYREQKLKY